jgi:hypothetical protein
MTSRKRHLGRLLELFLPEARFPDEKFWTKDGTPIYPKPKGPGDVQGLTMKDLGVEDEPEESPLAPNAESGSLFNHFSKTFSEFIRNIDTAAKKLFGNDYQKTIDDYFKQPGYVRDVIRRLWDGNWTDSEALSEIGFIFDVVQSGIAGDPNYNPSHYPHLARKSYGQKVDWDHNTGTIVSRRKRPVGLNPDGTLRY